MRNTYKTFIAIAGVAFVGITLLRLLAKDGAVSFGAISVSGPEATLLGWDVPANNNQWKEDVKKESLNVKSESDLDQMLGSLTEKLPRTEEGLLKVTQYPDAVRWEVRESLKSMMSGAELDAEVEKQYQEQLAYWERKTAKIKQSIIRIEKEKQLRTSKVVDRTNEIIE